MKKRVAIIATILLVLLIIAGIIGANMYKTASPATSNELSSVKLEYNNIGVKITNETMIDLTDCFYDINNIYSTSIPTLQNHTSIRLAYKDFSKKDGTRLNTKTTKPVRFSILCSNGKDNWYDQFTFTD